MQRDFSFASSDMQVHMYIRVEARGKSLGWGWGGGGGGVQRGRGIASFPDQLGNEATLELYGTILRWEACLLYANLHVPSQLPCLLVPYNFYAIHSHYPEEKENRRYALNLFEAPCSNFQKYCMYM